jgi:hypothetical protein
MAGAVEVGADSVLPLGKLAAMAGVEGKSVARHFKVLV